jgi:DNA-binding MarR family transcriptional regulator
VAINEQSRSVYLDAVRLIERLHRCFLDIVKLELDRLGRGDVNSVQALILFNIGDAEMTVGDLTLRGYYLGSNVSYNVKKLVENGYIAQERSAHDRRSVKVRLTPKGLELREHIASLYDRHVDALDAAGTLAADKLGATNGMLKGLERFWSERLRLGG